MSLRDRPRRLIRRETVDPARLTPADRARFARGLYDLHCQIFAGVPFDRFLAHVIEPRAERTAIQLYHGETGAVVGYCGFHSYLVPVGGRRIHVLRAEAGLLPDYRGRAAGHWFGMVGSLKAKLRHPFTPVYYFGTLVHPSSYRFFCKYFPRVYPRLDGRGQAGLAALAAEIADAFPDPPVRPEGPLVRQVGWITIETDAEPKPGGAHDNADVRAFLALNPGYRQGHGLVVLVPITFGNVGRAILRRLLEVAHGAIRRRHMPMGTLEADRTGR